MRHIDQGICGGDCKSRNDLGKVVEFKAPNSSFIAGSR